MTVKDQLFYIQLKILSHVSFVVTCGEKTDVAWLKQKVLVCPLGDDHLILGGGGPGSFCK